MTEHIHGYIDVGYGLRLIDVRDEIFWLQVWDVGDGMSYSSDQHRLI